MGGRGPALKRGQSTVEFALSSVVLVFLLLGLLDFGRGFYFAVRLQDAAREGARVGAHYDAQKGLNSTLDDTDIANAVNNVLTNSGMPKATLQNTATTCPATKNGNPDYQPPFQDSAFPSGPGQPYLYICYQNVAGRDPASSNLVSPVYLTRLNVIVLYRFGLVTGFLQNQLGPSGIEMFGQYQADIQ